MLIGLFAVALGACWIVRGSRTKRLRDAVELERTQQGELNRLKKENKRLAAAQPATDELQALRGDHEAVERLRGELTELRTRTLTPPRSADRAAMALPAPITTPGEWKNAGCATPAAALETALWAASGGDIDTVALLIVLEPAVRAKTVALLEGLPAASRAEYRSPERLVALLATKDVPMGGIQVIAQARQGAEQTMIRVRLYQPDGSAKSTSLLLRQNAGEWRLVVPESAVDRYAAMLKGPAGPN